MAILQRCCTALQWDARACEAYISVLADTPGLVHHVREKASLYYDNLRATKDGAGGLTSLLQYAKASKVRVWQGMEHACLCTAVVVHPRLSLSALPDLCSIASVVDRKHGALRPRQPCGSGAAAGDP